MKIISKFRDFYDYKVAKYGVDEKLVYTRKTYCEYYETNFISIYTSSDDRILEENFNKNLKEEVEYFKRNNCHKILILGEKLIHLFFTENGVYTHFDIKNPEDIKKKYGYYSYYNEVREITFNDEKSLIFIVLLNMFGMNYFLMIGKDFYHVLIFQKMIFFLMNQ